MAGSGTQGPNLGLWWGWLDGESGWGLGGFNPNMALLDALLNAEVISSALTAPPASPAEGDRYIVAASGTGAWAGHDNALAVFRGSAWAFYAPKKGLRVYNSTTAKFLYFDGAAWSIEAGSSAVGEAPSDGKLYYRKDGAWTLGQQDISLFLPGIPSGTSALLARYVFPRAVTLPAGLVGSQGYAGVAAAGATTLVLRKNGVDIGTVNFAAGAQVATFTLAAAVSFAAGDRLSAYSPSSLDATMADVSLTFVGNRS